MARTLRRRGGDPEFPNAHHSGFVGKVDLEGLADGEHSLVVRVRSRDGCEMELIRSFRLEPNARPDRADLNAEYPVWLARRTPSESDLARMRIEGRTSPIDPSSAWWSRSTTRRRNT